MKNDCIYQNRFSTYKTTRKIFYSVAIACALALTARAQIVNGSFENGFTGWDTTPGDFIIGIYAYQPIGTDGYNSADLGGGDIIGAVLSQTISNFAHGGTYHLDYDSACNDGDYPTSLITQWEVLITGDGQQIASETLSQLPVGSLAGSLGFQHQEMTFTVDPGVQNITINFLDVTPNGGYHVDTALDQVAVTSVPEPATFSLLTLGGLVLGWRRRGQIS
ncbi:MAG: PEP-CTERM sorting domain-containing protein [Limisphaerales bacterium]